MKILITGNMGYIGPCVEDHLRKTFTASTLVGYDMGYFASCLTNAAILPECRLDVQFFNDMRQFPDIILDGVESIVHLAAISNDPMGTRYASVTEDINYRASVALAKKAKAHGVKSFTFASSCSMYGSADDHPRTETSTLNPLTAYAKSKVATEKELNNLADDTFKVTSLRFSTACGMSDRLRLDLVLNDFVAGAVASNNITILSDGTPWRPLINIKDMARAIEWAIIRDRQNGGNFLAVNVGSEEWNYQVRDLAETVAKIIPGVRVSVNQKAAPDNRSYKVNFDLFKKMAPDHQPQFDLEDSIKELQKGLKNMKFNNPDFRNSRYMRLKVLTDLQTQGLLTDELEWAKV
jgi:nucleoside-diphosphate-sugar epimerase